MAKFGNLPEVVKYTEFGVEHLALPIGSRELEHHAGENGELLLNLVIVKPLVADACANCGNRRIFHGKPAPAHLHVCSSFVEPDAQAVTDNNTLVFIVTDVPHETHAFTEEQLKAIEKTGVNTAQAYPGGAMPGGRWSDISNTPVVVAAVPEPPTEQTEPESPTVQ